MATNRKNTERRCRCSSETRARVPAADRLAGTLAVIMIFGLVMLFSASYTTGYLRMGDSFHYIKQQALCMILGLGCMFLISYVDHVFCARWWCRVHHRAGHAGRHPDHGTPERLPPLGSACRPYAAILGGGKV